ncbi:ABC transporter ATP-binding protein [Natrarchaeobius chitinivorans]|uniref:ABC transporter ATP-binding protein n=1 Tax=Natrarchaeobius chitinivorans TaxID=1679083 RepID=UPI001FB3D978|nr:ABC transporter ATP-binding protein [Natrarchaeobius chitinivorans]
MSSSDEPLLEVENLRTEFRTDRGTVKAADGVSFSIERGETYGVVGESGAGKTVTGLSVIGLIDNPGQIVGGEIRYKGRDLRTLSQEELRSIRGDEIAMIFQDPMTALNPAYTVGTQIIDTILTHNDCSKSEARERTIKLLEDVGIPDPEERVDSYPHQFSGGMRQRALIAMALSCDPDLIIADEPTTALDVTIQAQILDLLDDLQEKHGLSIQLITHDMGLVAEMCDRVSVMYAGKKIEEGPVGEIFSSPKHPYTVGLMNAVPRLNDPRERLEAIPGNMPDLIDNPSGCSFRPRCEYATEECKQIEPPLEPAGAGGAHTSACLKLDEIDFDTSIVPDRTTDETPVEGTNFGEPIIEADGLQKYFDPENQSWFEKYLGDRDYVHAVEDVSLTVHRGETLGIVGESGCGKSTLGRVLLRLYEPDEGTIVYSGDDITEMGRSELRNLRSEVQMVFQDPFSSLNPQKTVLDIIGRPLEVHDQVANSEEKRERVVELLEDVGMSERHLNRYPHEFSGGQKQRIGIARALAVEPDFIVADEPVSALDVSVQAKIINMLDDLQEKYDLTYLFIAHDLNVVQHISDHIGVMYLGEIVEFGTVQQVFEPPYHPYTEILLSSIPKHHPDVDEERIDPDGELPSAIHPPSGCRFHTRCPQAMPECETKNPEQRTIDGNHEISCHLFDSDGNPTDEYETTIDVSAKSQMVDPGEPQ